MENVMIDIETLGTKPYSVLLSLAGVEFDLESGETGRTFYQNISIQSCLDHNLVIEEQTLLWWLKQDKQAQETLINPTPKRDTLDNVLYKFYGWLINIKQQDKPLYMWGNSNRFDLGLLSNAMERVGIEKMPWNFYDERDVRTLVHFNPQIKKDMVFEGVKHSALDDCYHQIKYCSEIYRSLKTT